MGCLDEAKEFVRVTGVVQKVHRHDEIDRFVQDQVCRVPCHKPATRGSRAFLGLGQLYHFSRYVDTERLPGAGAFQLAGVEPLATGQVEHLLPGNVPKHFEKRVFLDVLSKGQLLGVFVGPGDGVVFGFGGLGHMGFPLIYLSHYT